MTALHMSRKSIVVLVGIVIAGSVWAASAMRQSPAAVRAEAAVSYNPGYAAKFHAPLSSMGLVALNNAPPRRASGDSRPGPSPADVPSVPVNAVRFTTDTSYLPQTETTIAVDPSNPAHVVGGVNDFRWFYCSPPSSLPCPSGWTDSLSGFTVSADGGRTVLKSDAIPSQTKMVADRFGVFHPELMISWGDPSLAAGVHGEFFYASLSISETSFANGIELAVSTANLFVPSNACTTPLGNPTTNPCWQATMVYANLTDGALSFEDKDLLAVDRDSSSPFYGDVYVAWDHVKPSNTAESWVARCTPALTCTMISGGGTPPLSGGDLFPAFTTPAVGTDGAAHFTWCNYGTFTDLGPISCRVRSTAPNGGAFGTIATIMSFEGFGTTFPAVNGILGLSTEQFRTDSIGAVAVDTSLGSNNLYFTIAACTSGSYYDFYAPHLPGNCGAASIFFSRSTDGGASWSFPTIISQSGQNVMPWVTVDPVNGNVVVAYFTTQFDAFNHRIDVVASVSTDRGFSFGAVRLTNVSDEPNADPGLFNNTAPSGSGGALFAPQFGDYLQAVALGGQIWVLFNGNYASELGTLQLDPWLVVGSEHYTLSVGAQAARTATDVGVPVAFTGSVSGGTPPFTFEWTFLDGNASADPRPVHAFASPGTYTVVLSVTDSVGATARATVPVLVNPSLSATATASDFNPPEGRSIDFSSTVSGGTSPERWHWSFGDGSTSDSALAAHAFGRSGTYTVILWVNDSVGASSTSIITVVVASSNQGISTTAASVYAIVAFLAGLAIAFVVLMLLARRREKVRPPTPPETGPPPSG